MELLALPSGFLYNTCLPLSSARGGYPKTGHGCLLVLQRGW